MNKLKRVISFISFQVLIASSFLNSAFAQSSGTGNMLTANALVGNSTTDAWTYIMTIAKYFGLTMLGSAVAGGSYLLVTGIWQMSKLGKQGSEHSNGNMVWKITAGALLVVASLIISIIVFTMSNPGGNNSVNYTAPSVNSL